MNTGMTADKHGDRVAVVAGLRTPFAERATAYREMTGLDLGRVVVRELIARTELDPREVGLVVYGQAVPSPSAPNIAREIVLGSGLPKSVDAYSVARACATSFQAATSAAEAILAGQHDVAIAGGAESATDGPILLPRALATNLVEATRVSTIAQKLRVLSRIHPRDLVPIAAALGPRFALARGEVDATKEPSTGLTLGEHAERMAKEHGVTREEQDRLAHRSHARAAAAWERGLFDVEVMHVIPPPSFDRPIAKDGLVFERAEPEAYAKLRPVFDPEHGSVTVGNSSAATDGASALLLMRESRAKALGYRPLGYLRSWSYASLDPVDGLLMGAAYATPIALDRAGLRLTDIDVVDMHEAFAAQVVCNRRALASRRFAEEKLGRTSGAVGEIDDDRFNVHGGSIAFGHPFAATGARIIHTVLRELQRRRGQFGLATGCAAGGTGAAIVLEAA